MDGTPVPKRVAVWHLSWIVFFDLYYIKCICSLTYSLQVQDISHLFVSAVLHKARRSDVRTWRRQSCLIQGTSLLSKDWHIARGQVICDVSQCCWTGGYRRSPKRFSGDTQRCRPEHSKFRTLTQYNCEEWPLTLHNPAGRIWTAAQNLDTLALHDGLRAFLISGRHLFLSLRRTVFSVRWRSYGPRKSILEKGEAEAGAAERVQHCTWLTANISTGNRSMTIHFDPLLKIRRNLATWVRVLWVFMYSDTWWQS